MAIIDNSWWWKDVTGIWFAVWAIRSKGELDRELDPTARLIRWLVAIPCLTLSPKIDSETLRLSVGITGLLFLVWPNTAYHLTKLLRFLHVLPKAVRSGDDDVTTA
jgi:hypothetical protein